MIFVIPEFTIPLGYVEWRMLDAGFLNILGMEKISQNEGFEPVQTLRRLREGCGISALPAMILEKIKKRGSPGIRVISALFRAIRVDQKASWTLYNSGRLLCRM